MSLYTEPPTGNISCQKLERFALKRLDFLLKVAAARGDMTRLHQIVWDPKNVIDSDCLITRSVKDKVSHFILRLLMGGDAEMRMFFHQAESAWFDFNFSCMSEDEMEKFFHSVDKVLKANNIHSSRCVKPVTTREKSIANILGVFWTIKKSVGSWKDVIRLYMAQCRSSYFYVPFQCVLSLVRQRQVTLYQGMARVPITKLREVVAEQFSSLIQLASVQASSQFPAAIADDRLKLLWRKIKHVYRKHHQASLGVGLVPRMSLDQVDTMMAQFPLCMSSLLQSLRQKHRLGHHARIQLTLFLKDLGLPVHHALAMWQQEYSRPSGQGSSCKHSWQTDSQRYTYSIRHLYGLEGARRNYHGHRCESLQQHVVGCNAEGGCPFSHWDSTSLSAELVRLGLHTTDVTNVLSLCGAGLFSAACHQCLHLMGSSKTNPAQSTHNKDFEVHAKCVAVQTCQQVTISSSPDILYRTDCSVNQGEVINDMEDLVDIKGISSVQKTGSVSGKDCGYREINTVVKNQHLVTIYETERPCKRTFDTLNEKKVSTLSASSSRGLEDCVSSGSISPTSKRHKVMSEDSSCCVERLYKSLPSTKTPQDKSCLECQTIQYFDHEVNPCTSQDSSSSSSTKVSSHPVIFKPVHYVRASYQLLLQSLKS